jgi:hypothetical protein
MSQQKTFRGQILNACVGALVFTFYGGVWASLGIWSLGRRAEPTVAIILALALLLLVVANISYVRRVLRLPQDVLTPEMRARVKYIKRVLGIINLIEGVAIGAAFTVGFILKRPDNIPPVIALIVGLHFFALAPVLRMRADYIIGTLLCLLSLLVVVALPVYTGVGDTVSGRVYVWGAAVGIGSAVVLWLGAITRLLNVRAMLVR